MPAVLFVSPFILGRVDAPSRPASSGSTDAAARVAALDEKCQTTWTSWWWCRWMICRRTKRLHRSAKPATRPPVAATPRQTIGKFAQTTDCFLEPWAFCGPMVGISVGDHHCSRLFLRLLHTGLVLSSGVQVATNEQRCRFPLAMRLTSSAQPRHSCFRTSIEPTETGNL